jgi:hypothetical protein
MVGWIEAAVLVPRDRLQALDFRVSVIPHSTLFDASEPGLGEPLQPLKMARSSGCRLVVLPPGPLAITFQSASFEAATLRS